MTDDNVKTDFFKHRAGDGRHLINDNFQVFKDGSYQMGDPSDICIVFNASRLCSAFGLPPLWELWTQAYPEDPMTKDNADCIFSEAEPYSEPCDPTIPDDRLSILLDLEAISCDKLASIVKVLLTERGVYC